MTDTTKAPYHHGDLPAALLRSARTMLEEDGIASLKLRAVTRHAGVSATAAAPHFGNLTGLLSALAAEGFAELADAMSPERASERRDIALAYVRFAIANPGLFTLMFRSDAIDRQDAGLQTASARAFDRLSSLASAGQTKSRAATMVGLWGKVHGVAVLAVDGLLTEVTATNNPQELDAVLEEVFR